MQFATRTLLAAFALVLWAGSASAQNDVTFQVDLQPYIDTCQFDPSGTPPQDSVFVRGSFNDFSKANPLADADGDGVYTGVVSLPEGGITYKFYTNNESMLGWENDVTDNGTNDRDYTVTAGAQTIASVQFNKGNPVDNCSAVEETYELTFVVDMTTPIGRGDLDTSTDRVVVAGGFTSWTTTPLVLSPESDDPNVYSGTLTTDLTVPSDQEFKFVIQSPNGSGGFTDAYESPNGAVTPLKGGNRLIRITGDEEEDATTGNRFVEYDNDDDPTTLVTFGDAPSDALLTAEATVTFVVDLRPAFYAFADSSRLPGEITDAELLDDVYVNGPIFGESEGVMEDWAGWTADALGEARKLTYNSADTTASITLTYPAGAYNLLAGKLSVGGADNEGGFAGDKQVSITEGTQTIDLIFGAQIQSDGTYQDESGDNGSFNTYDPYILIDNNAVPPTATVVRRGGEDDVALPGETGPTIAGLEVSAPYPNPVRGRAELDLELDRALDLTVAVYDVVGRRVATLVDGPALAGTTTVGVDVTGLAPGVYLLRVEADGQAVTRRMTVLR